MHKSFNQVIVAVADVGYRVFVGENFLNELKVGAPAELYTHQQIREEASELYGFKTFTDLELFELLLTVSGVGPKSALGVLAVANADDIKEAIIRDDANLLTKVSGIGKKTAERIVLELKNKIVRAAGGAVNLPVSGFAGDEIEALMSLGYSSSEARAALNAVPPEVKDSGERVKAALKKMAQK